LKNRKNYFFYFLVLVLQHDPPFADPGFGGFSVMAGWSCNALLEMPDS